MPPPADSVVATAVERAADPRAAGRAIERLSEVHPAAAVVLHDDAGVLRAVVAVASASSSLARLLGSDPLALEVLSRLDQRPELVRDDAPALARWKHLEQLRIAARDLLGIDALEATGAALAQLADEVLADALRLGGLDGAGLAVIGMGKLGGRELNYASDVDILFVGEADPKKALEVARQAWRVDVDLRPEGRNGPLTRSLDSYRAYWKRWAQTWEFQALIKARAVAGDSSLGEEFLRAAAESVWTRPFGADDLRQVRDMKARTEGEVRRKGMSARELKRGPGGIRDIEFAVQLLQLVHGRADSGLRSPTTLTALSELASAGYVAASDAEALDEAYRFLRATEHRLQLVEDQQVHALPTDAAGRTRLARVMGFRDDGTATATVHFEHDLRRHQATVRSIHQRLFFRPLLEAFAQIPASRKVHTVEAAGAGLSGARTGLSGGGSGLSGGGSGLSGAAIAERLAAFGFSDAERTRQAVGELTRGFTRSSRLMQQLLPLLFEWLSDAPDPDLGLLGLRSLASGQHRRDQLVGLFRESPEAARRLCLLLGTSPLFERAFERQPELLGDLAETEPYLAEIPRGALTALPPGGGLAEEPAESPAGPPSGSALARTAPPLPPASPAATKSDLRIQAATSLSWRAGPDERRKGLERVVRTEWLRLAAGDVLGLRDVSGTERGLSTLAEVVLETALDEIKPPIPFAVIAMGRFGGGELSYASDLDVLFVYDSDQTAAGEATATALMRYLNGNTPATRLWTTDADLRPEGRQGPLARSLVAYQRYTERWAQLWERQAWLRGRFTAGDPEVGRRLEEIASPFVWHASLSDDDVREIRRMKARIERERIPTGEDPQFHLKLGRGSLSDVEWTVQLLQLRHHIRAEGTMAALDALAAAGALDEEDAAVMRAAYRFCEETRNRLYLVRGFPGDALPGTGPVLTHLARSLGTTPTELREEYRRRTRRCRQVVERVFYGRNG